MFSEVTDPWYPLCPRCGGKGEYYWETDCDCCGGWDDCDVCDGLGFIIEPWKEWRGLIDCLCEKCGFYHGYGCANLEVNPDHVKCINCGHINYRPREHPRSYLWLNDPSPWISTSDTEEYLWSNGSY